MSFVHLHTHSEFSSLDGFSTIDEIVEAVTADGNPAVAITDHGTCAAHPHLQKACEAAGINPIFGIEANFVNDRFRRPPERPKELTPEELEQFKAIQAEIKDYWHLTLYAMNDIGLRNLWAMSTEANRDGYYYRPRMDWDTLERYNEGVICSTACLRGPVSRALLQDQPDIAEQRMSRLQQIFGDRLYAEVHTNQMVEQFKVNEGIVKIAAHMGIPLIAVCDSHYQCPEHKSVHKVWIAAQTGKTVNEDSDLFDRDEDYHLMPEEEVFMRLGGRLGTDAAKEAIANTVRLAERCTARLSGNPTPPVFDPNGVIQNDIDLLMTMCLSQWGVKIVGKPRSQEEYAARLEREMKLLIAKDLCGYFCIVADYCSWAKRRGILVGPGRGSGGASLVAYLSGITEIDPVDAELPFERFLTPGRTELPDFDIDFPSERLEEVMNYIAERYGQKSVVRVGTHIRLKNKGILQNLAMVLRGEVDVEFMDLKKMSEIITAAEKNTAGLGLTWDELWDSAGDELEQYKVKYPRLFDLASVMVGRLKSYGKHAAGVIIAAGEDLTERLPMRVAGDKMVAEFDMDALAALGLVKFDFLGLRNLDTLQQCVELIKKNTGVDIDLYRWNAEYNDQDVWKFVSEGNTLGCFQLETPAMTKMAMAVQPRNLHDMADVNTLDRPGPLRSGLDKIYLRRRFGREAVSFADPRLEKVLHRTFGVMLYQEDIMGICRELAGYDEEQADKVRKILGKKKVEAARAEGDKFIPACVERGLTQEAAEAIWKQMEEFSRYSFNKAHAYGYGILGYWCAWLSYHYPVEFFVAAMSTVDAERIPDFVIGAKNRGCSVLPPDINDSGVGFSAKGSVIRFGLDAIKGVGKSAVTTIVEHQPYLSFEQFMEHKPNMGIAKTVVRAGCLDSLNPNRRQLEGIIAQYESGETSRCVDWDPAKVGAPNDLPCQFDWSSEPLPLGKKGKPLKQKPIPRACTVRCRNYRQRTSLTPIDVKPYTDQEIREIETELFGIYLSSSPFDGLPADFPTVNARQIGEQLMGLYPVAAIVKAVRLQKDKKDRQYAFVELFLGDGNISAVCFSSRWPAVRNSLKPGNFVLAAVEKTARGYTLQQAVEALDDAS